MGSLGGFRSTVQLFLATVRRRPQLASKVGVTLEFIMMDWSDIVRYAG